MTIQKITCNNTVTTKPSASRQIKDIYEPFIQTSNNKNIDQYNPQQKIKFDKQGYPIPDGKTLKLSEEETVFFFFKKEAEYTYIANGRESIRDIRSKFRLKDGALKKCNANIVDVDWVPQKGTKIFFMKDDINVKNN